MVGAPTRVEREAMPQESGETHRLDPRCYTGMASTVMGTDASDTSGASVETGRALVTLLRGRITSMWYTGEPLRVRSPELP